MRYSRSTLSASLFMLASPFSFAQSDIEEILVTADFRQTSLNNVSSSVSVVDATTIEQQNARHLEEILGNTPNVNFSSGSSRARFFQIRGIGERGQFSEPLNPSVGLLIDGVDFSGIGSVGSLYDVEQVEVLLGPQGTRYGSNALAGLINMQSKAPTETNDFGVELEHGNLNTRSIAGFISGPISDTLQYRIAAQSYKSDGFNQNLFLNRPTNEKDETTLRAKLRWLPSQNTSVDFQFTLNDIDNGYDAFSLDNIRDTLSDEPGFDQQESKAFNLKVNTRLSNGIVMETLVAHANSDIAYGYDEDWAYVGIHPWEYSSTDHYFRDRDTTSAELRFLSGDSTKLFNNTDWVAGIYSLQQNVDLNRIYTYLSSPYTSAYELNRLAAYADTNTPLSDNVVLEVGLRVESFDGDYNDSNALTFSPNETLFGGRLALNYLLDDASKVYASLSRGYKTGGFNIDGSLDADLREFDSEQLWNYELGYKANLFNNQLSLQAALFYMDRDDVQISSSTTRLRSNGSTEFIDFIGNAAAGNNYGLELNTHWQVNSQLAMYATLGLLETEYENFINSTGDNLDGREQAHAPNYQFNAGVSYLFTENLEANLWIQGKDSYYFSDSHDIQSSAYEIWNMSVAYQFNNWHVSAWGRNLSDKDYAVRGFYFGNDPRDFYTAKGYTQLGEPRRYGITVKYDY